MKGINPFLPGHYYHIVNHAVGFENLFRENDNYYYFLNRYDYHMSSVWSTLAYCLMPNHIHFLIRVHPLEQLIKHPKFKGEFHKVVMQQWSNLLNGYAKAFNKKYNRRGALWIDFSKRFIIENEKQLINTIEYIKNNPVKHGFINDATDWKFTSIIMNGQNVKL